VPRPTSIPGSTMATAVAAAFRFSVSRSISLAPPEAS
jgi:hypothetical protein